jgi:hypothetical protein
VTGGRVRTLTGAAGLLAVALLVVGAILVPDDPPAPSATAELVVRWTLLDRRALLIGSVLIAAGLAVGIVFFAGLRALCARAEGPPGLFATIGWGATLVALAITFVALGLVQTQSYLVLDGDPATVEAFHDARLLLADIAGLPAAIGLTAFGTAMVRTRFPARWLGGLGGLAALTQLAGVVALSRQGFFSPSGGATALGSIGVVTWVTAVSAVLLSRPGSEDQPAGPAAGAVPR